MNEGFLARVAASPHACVKAFSGLFDLLGTTGTRLEEDHVRSLLLPAPWHEKIMRMTHDEHKVEEIVQAIVNMGFSGEGAVLTSLGEIGSSTSVAGKRTGTDEQSFAGEDRKYGSRKEKRSVMKKQIMKKEANMEYKENN